jgi:endonuclease G
LKIKTVIVTIIVLLAAFVAGNACISSVGDKNSQSDDLLLQNARKQGLLLKRTAYTLSYDKDTRLPIWVAWCLTKEHTYGPYKRKGLHFEEDTAVPKPRATYFDYMQSGYSRGHMCPSGDNRWSQQAQQESFLYTNCCPQLYSLNAGDWNELEMKCRHWANKYGEIYIVCGPLLFNKQHRTIGKNRVVVPEAFFKVVLCMQGTPKAIGFIYRNEETNKPVKSYVNTIDQVERITGIDFFPALPDDIENKVEANSNIDDWE